MVMVLVPLHVDDEGRVTGRVPASVPPGDYTAPIEVPVAGAAEPVLELPVDDEPWDDRISLRREDLYGESGH
jgi:hypothetical protein